MKNLVNFHTWGCIYNYIINSNISTGLWMIGTLLFIEGTLFIITVFSNGIIIVETTIINACYNNAPDSSLSLVVQISCCFLVERRGQLTRL